MLITRRTHGFVLGTIKEPSDKNIEEYEAWVTCHRVIRQWILSSVSKEITSQVMCTDDASMMWNDLRDQLRQSNKTHIYQLS